MRIICPKHNRPASLRIKLINGRYYAYARHYYGGRKRDCYLGPYPECLASLALEDHPSVKPILGGKRGV